MPVLLNAPLCNFFLSWCPRVCLFIYLFTDSFCWGGKWEAENAIHIFKFNFILIYFVAWLGVVWFSWEVGKFQVLKPQLCCCRDPLEQVPTAPKQFHFLQQKNVGVVTSIPPLHQPILQLHPQMPPNPRQKTACNILPLLHKFHLEKAELRGFWNGCLISASLARNDPVAPSNYTINLWEGYKAVKAVVMVCNLIAEL